MSINEIGNLNRICKIRVILYCIFFISRSHWYSLLNIPSFHHLYDHHRKELPSDDIDVSYVSHPLMFSHQIYKIHVLQWTCKFWNLQKIIYISLYVYYCKEVMNNSSIKSLSNHEMWDLFTFTADFTTECNKVGPKIRSIFKEYLIFLVKIDINIRLSDW